MKDFHAARPISLSEVDQSFHSKEIAMNHKRHVYALIGAILLFVLIRVCGESLANGMLKVVESISKLRNQSRD